MKLSAIIDDIKNNNLEYEFQTLDAKANFSFQFKKTREYWSQNNWLEVARQMKKEYSL